MSEHDYITLIDAAHQQLHAPIIMVWERLNTHRSQTMIDARTRLRMPLLPPCVPDLNAAEGVQRAHAIAAALARGPVSILVNNAATVEPLGATSEIAPCDLRRAFEVFNVLAPAALAAAVLPGMTAAGWGRIVNVSSGIVAHPEAMVRGNAYASTKAALEAHTLNLAEELRGTGVTVNVYRPGRVDTAMQEWIRGQDPERIGAALHGRFTRFATSGELITPERAAASLLARLVGEETGLVWDVDDLVVDPAGDA